MRIFLTGGSGLLGGNVIRAAHERGHEVFAALHRTPLPEGLGVEQAVVDLEDADDVAAALERSAADAVVHCAYLPGLERIDRNRDLAWRAMVDATRTLARAADLRGLPLAFVSTDFVFDGRDAPFDEAASPNPLNHYGVLKVIGETIVRTVSDRNLVARVAGVFGVTWADPERSGSQDRGFGFLVNETVAHLREGRPYTVWTEGATLNEVATPTLASDASATLLELLERGAAGTWHCVGGEHATRVELARAAARAFGLDPDLVRRGPVPAELAAEGRDLRIPADTRLDASATFAAAGREPLSLDDALAAYRRQIETEVAA